MSIGMTWEDYWHGDLRLVGTFLDAYRQKQKRKMERHNEEAWLQGMYFYNALQCSLSSIKGKSKPYPAEPYELSIRNKAEEEIPAKTPEELELEQARVRGLQARLLYHG